MTIYSKEKGIIFEGLAEVLLLIMYGYRPREYLLYICILLSVGLVGSCYFYIYLPKRQWNKKINEIVKSKKWMDFLEDEIWKSKEVNRQITNIVDGLIEYNVQKESIEAYERQAELIILQSQINPHFLYNTLDSIRGQALFHNETDIAVMLEALGNFFRYSISRKDSIVTLREELYNMDNYIRIQNYRFQNRFVIEMDESANDPEIQECIVPKLMLQPIVENAIVHGLENKLQGKVVISVDATSEILLITISDDGDGMSPETLEKLSVKLMGKRWEENRMNRHGIALPNVNSRIKTLFGEEYGICIYSTKGKGTDVEIMLPRKIYNK